MQIKQPEITGVQILTIESTVEGQRIDNFLGKLSNNVPKSHIYRIIRTGQVRVNGGRIKATYKLKSGDKVRVPPLYNASKEVSVVPDTVISLLEAAVVLETEDLIVLNKPARIAVHGGSGLHFGVIEAFRQARQQPNLELIHRLDRGTSGCLLIGKHLKATRSTQDLFRASQVKKRYLALVAGRWDVVNERIELPLVTNQMSGGERKVVVSAEGKTAISIFSRLVCFQNATLMSVVIETGRTHQIRVSAAQAGHAVVGDSKYGNRRVNQDFRKLGLKRLFLHAAELGFADGSDFHVEIPVDTAWRDELASLSDDLAD